MTEFRTPRGFEDLLRPPIDVRRARLTPAVLKAPRGGYSDTTAERVRRIVRRAPEVMVKVTGRTRDAGHLKAHLDYISRNGGLALEGPDGERLQGRPAVRALADDWARELEMAARRKDSPVSHAIILSMPSGTDPRRLEDAARAFAADVFGQRFPYVFALHDEGRHPHVHLTVRSLGRDGERLNPRKADLQSWREAFAAKLRERDIAAEATPRRARGVVLKAERTAVRKMRERFVRGEGPLPAVLEAAYREALGGDLASAPWRDAAASRQREVRRGFVALALALERSAAPDDRVLAKAIAAFVKAMPPVQTRAERLRSGTDRGLEIGRPDRGEDDRRR